MTSKLKSSGLFYGIVFLAAGIINFAAGIIDGNSILQAFFDFRNVLSILIIAALMFASAYVSFLAWIQPIAFLALTPVPLMAGPSSFYGLGFYAVGILLLFKMGFYSQHRIMKAIASVVYLMAIEVISGLRSGDSLYDSLMPVFFIVAFLFFLFLTFRDRIVIYLKEPKIRLSLDAKGLAESEQLYIRRMIGGRSVKEVSFEFGVSESTVRNTLSRAYKKLGVNSKAGVADLSQKFEIVQ